MILQTFCPYSYSYSLATFFTTVPKAIMYSIYIRETGRERERERERERKRERGNKREFKDFNHITRYYCKTLF